MKKHQILKQLSQIILLGTFALCLTTQLSAQGLYVQPLNGEQVEFAFANRPKITFGAHALKIKTLTAEENFQLNAIQNLSFKKNASSSIATILNEHIFLYPNPVKDELTLTVQMPTQNMHYRLVDISGKQLQTAPMHSETTQIRMDNLRSGMYILQIEQNGQNIQSYKIIKQ